jgi:hypothetical protein
MRVYCEQRKLSCREEGRYSVIAGVRGRDGLVECECRYPGLRVQPCRKSMDSMCVVG